MNAVPGRQRRGETDDRADVPEQVVIVSHRFWRSKLGSDSAAIGRTIRVNRIPMTLIGVLPAEFRAGGELWLPFADRTLLVSGDSAARRPCPLGGRRCLDS